MLLNFFFFFFVVYWHLARFMSCASNLLPSLSVLVGTTRLVQVG